MGNFFSGGSSTSNPAYVSGGSTNNVIPKSNGSQQLTDSPLLSPDANTVRQANTTNAQNTEIYATTDSNASPVNFERLTLGYNTGRTAFQVFAEKGGTGSSRTIDIRTDGAVRVVDNGGSARFAVSGTAGTISQYANVGTAGSGASIVRAAARSTAQTAAVASVATFTPAADATLLVSANVLVTTATTHAFSATCAYTDEGNTARTVTLNFSLVAGGAFTTSIANANGTVPYMGMPIQIRAKAATAVTVATTGTFTTVTYNVEGLIQQVA